MDKTMKRPAKERPAYEPRNTRERMILARYGRGDRGMQALEAYRQRKGKGPKVRPRRSPDEP